MSSRPVGITILSVLAFLNAAAYAVLAVLSIVNWRALTAVLQALSPGGAGPAAMHLSMGRFLPVYYAAFLVITGALGLGFWKLWNWTRIVALALIGVNLLGAAAMMLGAIRNGSGAVTAVFLTRVVVSVVISVLIGWYLLSAKVREAFRPRATGLESGLPDGSVHHA